MKFTLDKANKFIEENKDRVDKKFYPRLNFAAPIGWINDPNGVSKVGDYYHLFYQYYPYGAEHGPMHWGHAKSKDGLIWEDLPVALAPDKDYDEDGVFSGSAIEKDEKLYAIYTGNIFKENYARQNQNIAISKDAINFTKYEGNPILDERNLPENICKEHFRDPKVFIYNEKYYMVVGTKTNDGAGTVLLYDSKDLVNWDYKSVLISGKEYLGEMAECPDLLLFENGRAALLVSAMEYMHKGKKYPHKTLIIEGKMNWDSYKFIPVTTKEMDLGFDYYAPQSSLDGDSYFAISWHQAWGKSLIPGELGHKWVGQMTIPQKIYEKDGEIKRSIHPKVLARKKLIEDVKVTGNNIEVSASDYIHINSDNLRDHEFIFKNDKEEVKLSFNQGKGLIDRSKVKYKIKSDDGSDFSRKEFEYEIKDKANIEIICDRSSIQFYINDEYSISNIFYSDKKLDKLIVNGNIDSLKLYRLKED